MKNSLANFSIKNTIQSNTCINMRTKTFSLRVKKLVSYILYITNKVRMIRYPIRTQEDHPVKKTFINDGDVKPKFVVGNVHVILAIFFI